MSRAVLASWGGYPQVAQTLEACHWRGELRGRLAALRDAHGSTLPHGNGRSYGDSCLAASDHLLSLRPLDRFIRLDRASGVLQAEAGITLGEILAIVIPQGWFLPVTPGTQFATLGGAIANDVHGKNHHVRGTFGRHLRRFALVRSDREPLLCSPQEHPELFAATIGGLGLTGVIEWAEIQLVPIRSSRIETTEVRFGSLAEFFAVSAELDPAMEYSVSWLDCLAGGAQRGRGIYTGGNHASYERLAVERPVKLSVPVTPPLSLVNRWSLRLFNELYWHRQPAGRRRRIVGYEPFFYPLDRILRWNRIYGRQGFQQYQCVIPQAEAPAAVGELLGAIARSGSGSFLAVLKRCGALASPGLLSFPMPGTTLALDFPQDDALVRTLFPRLDAIVREAGGRLYPAKDAHMRGADFRRSYPAWEQLEALRDPALCSRFWRRVTA